MLLLAVAAAHGAPAPSPSCNLSAQDVRLAGAGCTIKWFDANLRINAIQAVGTAESYKLAPGDQMMSLIKMGSSDDANALDFAQPPITDQLDAGARSFEFDVAYDPKGGLFKYPAGASMVSKLMPDDYVAAMSRPGFKVIHILDIDFNASCLAWVDCLKTIADWSRANPAHIPIVIALKSNDERTPMPGATRPVKFTAEAFDALEAEILSVFRRDELITPDMVRGDFATLREAAAAQNWPKLGSARGKILFFLDDTPQKVALYRGARRNLEGRLMFANGDEKLPFAAMITIEDPIKEAARITAAVKDGLIVHSYADADTLEARKQSTLRRDWAFASGAQIVSTDFLRADKRIGPYEVRLPGHLVAQCDAKLSPLTCAGVEVDGVKSGQ